MNATYFGRLPPNAVENIIRFCSARPNAKNWKIYIPSSDVLGLCCGGDSVAEFRRILLSEVCAGSPEFLRLMRARGENHLFVYNTRGSHSNVLEKIVQAGGHHVSKLAMGYYSPQQYNLIAENCVNIKELVVCALFPAMELLRSIGGQLHSLIVLFDVTTSLAKIVGTHCHQLERLEMKFHEHPYGSSETDNCSFIETVGGRLEHLAVNGPCSTGFLRSVQKSCRRLHSLELKGVEKDLSSPAFAIVLSNAEQFQNFRFEPIFRPYASEETVKQQPNRSQCEEIVRNCPRLSVSILCEWNNAAEIMAGLGDALINLTVVGKSTPKSNELRAGAAKCGRLRELTWKTYSRNGGKSSLRAILPKVRSSLVSLNIESSAWDVVLEDIDDAIRGVREFNYRGPFKRGMFECLNDPICRLETVVIRCELHGAAAFHGDCADIVGSFSRCHRLRELYAYHWISEQIEVRHEKCPEVQNVCSAYEMKSPSLYVNMYGTSYFPAAKSN